LYVFIFVFVLSSLMAWNDLILSSYIHPGEKLVIYKLAYDRFSQGDFMSKQTLKVRTPQFPLYSEVRHLLQIFEGVSRSAIKTMLKSIDEQTGTPRQPVDWTKPESWIKKRLTSITTDC
jgi:hypothetical protein